MIQSFSRCTQFCIANVCISPGCDLSRLHQRIHAIAKSRLKHLGVDQNTEFVWQIQTQMRACLCNVLFGTDFADHIKDFRVGALDLNCFWPSFFWTRRIPQVKQFHSRRMSKIKVHTWRSKKSMWHWCESDVVTATSNWKLMKRAATSITNKQRSHSWYPTHAWHDNLIM